MPTPPTTWCARAATSSGGCSRARCSWHLEDRVLLNGHKTVVFAEVAAAGVAESGSRSTVSRPRPLELHRVRADRRDLHALHAVAGADPLDSAVRQPEQRMPPAIAAEHADQRDIPRRFRPTRWVAFALATVVEARAGLVAVGLRLAHRGRPRAARRLRRRSSAAPPSRSSAPSCRRRRHPNRGLPHRRRDPRLHRDDHRVRLRLRRDGRPFRLGPRLRSDHDRLGLAAVAAGLALGVAATAVRQPRGASGFGRRRVLPWPARWPQPAGPPGPCVAGPGRARRLRAVAARPAPRPASAARPAPRSVGSRPAPVSRVPPRRCRGAWPSEGACIGSRSGRDSRGVSAPGPRPGLPAASRGEPWLGRSRRNRRVCRRGARPLRPGAAAAIGRGAVATAGAPAVGTAAGAVAGAAASSAVARACDRQFGEPQLLARRPRARAPGPAGRCGVASVTCAGWSSAVRDFGPRRRRRRSAAAPGASAASAHDGDRPAPPAPGSAATGECVGRQDRGPGCAAARRAPAPPVP